jgi:hypothetical protein
MLGLSQSLSSMFLYRDRLDRQQDYLKRRITTLSCELSRWVDLHRNPKQVVVTLGIRLQNHSSFFPHTNLVHSTSVNLNHKSSDCPLNTHLANIVSQLGMCSPKSMFHQSHYSSHKLSSKCSDLFCGNQNHQNMDFLHTVLKHSRDYQQGSLYLLFKRHKLLWSM